MLWLGGLVSLAGDWVLYAALPFFVYERTGSTLATSGMIAAELAPAAVVGSVAGVWVDRLDRRRLLVGANAVQASAVAALLLVSGSGPLWVVYAVAAVQASVASFAVPAESALLPSLVAAGDLVAANALTAFANRVARLAGVPAGGLLLGLAGLDAVILVDVASFLVAGALVAAVIVPPRMSADGDGSPFLREWLDGLRLVRADPSVAMLVWVLGLMTLGGTMIDPLYVAWVRDVLHRGPPVYGALLAVSAGAGIAGSLLVARFRSHASPRVLIGWSSVVAALALAGKWNVPIVAVAVALSVVGGATSVASAIGGETWIQESVADSFRGRVLAALGASGALCSLAGVLVGGIAARQFGVTTMLNVSAALILLSGFVVLRALPLQ
jgi:Na+/melibiose symporter-like transporter